MALVNPLPSSLHLQELESDDGVESTWNTLKNYTMQRNTKLGFDDSNTEEHRRKTELEFGDRFVSTGSHDYSHDLSTSFPGSLVIRKMILD